MKRDETFRVRVTCPAHDKKQKPAREEREEPPGDLKEGRELTTRTRPWETMHASVFRASTVAIRAKLCSVEGSNFKNTTTCNRFFLILWIRAFNRGGVHDSRRHKQGAHKIRNIVDT